MFALSGALYARENPANLLSIGAVDFGIIVDSTVIIVENIYRHLSRGLNAHLPIDQRILRASGEVQRNLSFSTAIMSYALPACRPVCDDWAGFEFSDRFIETDG